jgi:hypothetical protein
MPAKTSSETRAAIMAHHQHKLSGQKISDKLAELGMIVSKRTVNEIIREEKLKLQGIVKPPKRLGPQCLPSVRTKAAIKKVKFLVDRPNPLTHSQISRQTGISETTVRRDHKRGFEGTGAEQNEDPCLIGQDGGTTAAQGSTLAGAHTG